jgi:hypothetical protein
LKTRVSAILLCIVPWPIAAADIKGLTIGMDRAAVQSRLPEMFCMPSKEIPGREVCVNQRGKSAKLGDLETYAGQAIDSFGVSFQGGKLRHISLRLSTSKFLPVSTALSEKYGSPAIEKSTVQNRMGATFDQEEHTWKDGDDRLVARKRGSKLDLMEVTLSSESATRQDAEEAKARAKDASKDL